METKSTYPVFNARFGNAEEDTLPHYGYAGGFSGFRYGNSVVNSFA